MRERMIDIEQLAELRLRNQCVNIGISLEKFAEAPLALERAHRAALHDLVRRLPRPRARPEREHARLAEEDPTAAAAGLGEPLRTGAGTSDERRHPPQQQRKRRARAGREPPRHRRSRDAALDATATLA